MALFALTKAVLVQGKLLTVLGLFLIIVIAPALWKDLIEAGGGTKRTSSGSQLPEGFHVRRPSLMNYIRSDLDLNGQGQKGRPNTKHESPEVFESQFEDSFSGLYAEALNHRTKDGTSQGTLTRAQEFQSEHEGHAVQRLRGDASEERTPAVAINQLKTKSEANPKETQSNWSRYNLSMGSSNSASKSNFVMQRQGDPVAAKKISEDTTRTLRWTEDADAYIQDRLDYIQHPKDCSEMKWLVVDSDVSGLMWNFNAAIRALVVGLQTNRTVVFRGLEVDPQNPWKTAAWDGCADRTIGCFFNVTTCELQDQPQEDSNFGKLDEWPFWNPELRAEAETVRVVRSGALRSWPGSWKDIAPVNLWEDLVATGSVYLDGGGNPNESTDIQRAFMLFSITAKWMTKPVPKIKDVASQIMAQYKDVDSPIVSLHIRRVDKLQEDPYWLEHKQYRDPSEYGKTITELERKRGYLWPTVFVECDSEELLQRIVRDPAAFGLRAGARVMYNSLLNRSAIEQYHGHDQVPPELKAKLQEHFVATLYVMAQVSDYVVATLTSHVGRYLWEYTGAKKRLEQVGVEGELGYSLDQPTGQFYHGHWYA